VCSVRSFARHDGHEFLAGGEQHDGLRRVPLGRAAGQERQQQSRERPRLSGADADAAGARQRVGGRADAALQQRLLALVGRQFELPGRQPGRAAGAAPGRRTHVQPAVQPGLQLQLRADGPGLVPELAELALPGRTCSAGLPPLLAALLERQPEPAALGPRGGRRTHALAGGHGRLAGARGRRVADQDASAPAAEHQTRRRGRLEALLRQGLRFCYQPAPARARTLFYSG